MRVVWAVSTVPQFDGLTNLQMSLLLASVHTFKTYHPETTTVLYVSPYYYQQLSRMKVLDFWDEVHEHFFFRSSKISIASWDYAKIEALQQESEKVLYVDYDIVFWNKVLPELQLDYQYAFAEESLKIPGVYLSKSTLTNYGSSLKYGKVALNTGILYLEPSVVSSWNGIYNQEQSLILAGSRSWNIATQICISINQGGLGKLLDGKKYRLFVDDVDSSHYTHYLGWIKSKPEEPAYKDMFLEIKKEFPDIVDMVLRGSKPIV